MFFSIMFAGDLSMIQYPGGKPYVPPVVKQDAAHRGMDLEHDLNVTNDYYLATDKAVIYKKPTPVQVVKVDYEKRSKAKIVEAYYKVPSTIDYCGVYRGYHIDFEAKETRSRTAFPFAAIHEHQINYIDNVIRHGGISFVLMRFIHYNETYFVEGDKMVRAYRFRKRQSLPYEWFRENGILIPFGLSPRIDYLKIVDQIIDKENQ